MDIAIAGGHGKIALSLSRLLIERGDTVHGLIRNPDHTVDLEKAGIEPVICDMEAETDLRPFVEGADAVVFAAGAGPDSGPERKRTVDLGAALKLMDAGVSRYVMVSAIGAGDTAGAAEPMRPYLEAKAEADEMLQQSRLDFTIVRPGRLTDARATGHVAAGPHVERGDIPRADVALALVAVLDTASTVGRTFNLVLRSGPGGPGHSGPVGAWH
ncbi:MAG: SDR family oxidoreductase [Thermoleophilaceae bacterium]